MILTWILGCVVVLLVYTTYNLLRKNESYEDMLSFYEASIVNFHNQSELVLNVCRQLDDREMFEKDDEVGMLFEQIVNTVKQLEDVIYVTNSEEEAQQEPLLDSGNRRRNNKV